jgi:thiol-disulfide isomerase/thioredoxin
MKRSKLVKKLTVVALTMVAIASLAVGCTSSKEGSTNTANSNSKLFKEMKTEDINGNKVDSSIFSKYKLTVVNVWNTGCTPCVDEIPTLDKLNKEYEKNGVSIKGLLLESGVGLNDEEKKTVEDILKKAKSTYQQLTVSEDMLQDKTLILQSFPTTFFVDKDGNIVDSIEGSNDYDGWKAKIDEVLEKVMTNE